MQASTARTYVLGVLGIPPGENKEEMCFIADFYALKCILGDIPYEQKWLCQFDISNSLHALIANPASQSKNTVLHGSPESKRFTFQSMEHFYTVYRNNFKLRILGEIIRIVDEARSGDHIILAFFSHGQEADDAALKGGIQVGSADAWLYAHELRDAVQDARARLTLITTSCYADWQWKHGPWDLVAASQKRESLSLLTSISDQCRGSRLIATLPEIAANDFNATFRPEYTQSMTHEPISSDQPCSESSDDDKRFKEAGPLDLARLEMLIARWRETSAGTLRTPAHAVVASLVDSYDQGQISDKRMKILFTTLVWREKMELLAEKILTGFEDTRGWFTGTCLDYKDLQGHIDASGLHRGVEFGTILWGKLEELDLKVLGAGAGYIESHVAGSGLNGKKVEQASKD